MRGLQNNASSMLMQVVWYIFIWIKSFTINDPQRVYQRVYWAYDALVVYFLKIDAWPKHKIPRPECEKRFPDFGRYFFTIFGSVRSSLCIIDIFRPLFCYTMSSMIYFIKCSSFNSSSVFPSITVVVHELHVHFNLLSLIVFHIDSISCVLRYVCSFLTLFDRTISQHRIISKASIFVVHPLVHVSAPSNATFRTKLFVGDFLV